MYALFAAFYYVQSWLWILFQLIFNKIYHFSEALFWVLVILEGFAVIGLIIGGIVAASYGIYRASEAICKSENGNRYTVVGVIYIIYYIAWSLFMANGIIIANNKFVAIASIVTMFVFCISFVVMGRSKYKNSEDTQKNNTIKKSTFILVIIILIGASVYGFAYENAYYEAKINDLNSKCDTLKNERDFYEEGRDYNLKKLEAIEPEYNFYHQYAVICTTEGKRYHHYGCGHLEGRNFYIYNIDNAIGQGYTPCLDCCG